MRGLTIIVTGPDRARFRAALTLAATQAALGARARLFLDGLSVTLLRDHDTDHDACHASGGLPTTAELLDTCGALGVEILACQSGMAQAGVGLDAIGRPVVAGGLTTLLADLGDDRLLAL